LLGRKHVPGLCDYQILATLDWGSGGYIKINP
jgi:hypothetical protein